jgi:hypothetical protein
MKVYSYTALKNIGLDYIMFNHFTKAKYSGIPKSTADEYYIPSEELDALIKSTNKKIKPSYKSIWLDPKTNVYHIMRQY